MGVRARNSTRSAKDTLCCIPAHLKALALGMNIRVRYAPTVTIEQPPVLLLTHKTHSFEFPMLSSPGWQILVSKFAIRILFLLLL